MTRFLASAAALALATAPALADPGPDNGAPGLYLDGYVEGELDFSDGISEDVTLGGDFRGGWLSDDMGGFRFGVEIGVDANAIPGLVDITAPFGSVFVDTEFGTFSVGAPRSAVSDAMPETIFDMTPVTELTGGVLAGSLVTYMGGLSDDIPLGARYDGRFGPVDVALSYHEFQDMDARALSGALSYAYQNWTFTIGAEQLETPTTDINGLSLAATVDMGQYGGSLDVTHLSAASGDMTIATAEGFYRVTDQITVTAGLRHYDSFSGSDHGWLIGGEYQIGNGAFASATFGEDQGRQVANIGLGIRF